MATIFYQEKDLLGTSHSVITVQEWSGSDAEWDDRVASTLGGSYRQTSKFARHQERSYGEKPIFFEAVNDEGKLLGLLLIRHGPAFSWGLKRRGIGYRGIELMRLLAPCLYWGDGPVILGKENRQEIYSGLVERALEEAKLRQCIAVEAWPSFYGNTSLKERSWVYKSYTDLGFSSVSGFTFLVDLRKGEDELWKSIRKEGRNKVRRAEKQNIEIVEIKSNGDLLVQAHAIVSETATRNGVKCISFEDMCQSFSYHRSQGVFRAFIALHNGNGVAYQHMTCFNRVVQLGGVSYSNYSRKERLYGNDMMQWHVLKTALGMDCDWLDYGGVNPTSENPKLKGIYQFKAKWGGGLEQCNRFRYTHQVPLLSLKYLPSKIYQKILSTKKKSF